jgi:hypothetical protein
VTDPPRPTCAMSSPTAAAGRPQRESATSSGNSGTPSPGRRGPAAPETRSDSPDTHIRSIGASYPSFPAARRQPTPPRAPRQALECRVAALPRRIFARATSPRQGACPLGRERLDHGGPFPNPLRSKGARPLASPAGNPCENPPCRIAGGRVAISRGAGRGNDRCGTARWRH